MSVKIYMYFNGNCGEALDFYEQVFNTQKYQVMTYGQAPENPEYQLPEEVKNLVMHARMNISDDILMFSDTFPGSPFIVGNNISLTFMSKDIDEIKTVYKKLSTGGTIIQELEENFFSKCYGSLTDKFGIGWQFSHDNGETV